MAHMCLVNMVLSCCCLCLPKISANYSKYDQSISTQWYCRKCLFPFLIKVYCPLSRTPNAACVSPLQVQGYGGDDVWWWVQLDIFCFWFPMSTNRSEVRVTYRSIAPPINRDLKDLLQDIVIHVLTSLYFLAPWLSVWWVTAHLPNEFRSKRLPLLSFISSVCLIK